MAPDELPRAMPNHAETLRKLCRSFPNHLRAALQPRGFWEPPQESFDKASNSVKLGTIRHSSLWLLMSCPESCRAMPRLCGSFAEAFRTICEPPTTPRCFDYLNHNHGVHNHAYLSCTYLYTDKCAGTNVVVNHIPGHLHILARVVALCAFN